MSEPGEIKADCILDNRNSPSRNPPPSMALLKGFARHLRLESLFDGLTVVYRPARSVADAGESDAFAFVARPRLSDPDRVIGAKPSAFCFWLFRLLGAQAGDTLDDLFPGSGGVARAWAHFTSGSVV